MSQERDIRRENLRNADWRFLLPKPAKGAFRHLVLLGGSHALGQRFIDEGFAERVMYQLPCDGSADGLIIFAGATLPIRQARASLRSGGLLYWEVARQTPLFPATAPRRVKRALIAHDLVPLGLYWVSPSFQERQLYLPLEARHALRWYLTTLHTAATIPDRLQEPILHTLARMGTRSFALLAPRFAITAVAGAHAAGNPFVLQHPALPRAWQQSTLHPLVLTGGDDERSRAIMLPFAPSSEHPIGVLKVSRSSIFNVHTDVEQATLRHLHTVVDESLWSSIPHHLGTFQTEGLTVSMEDYLPGRRLASTSGRRRFPSERMPNDLDAATTWLIRFQRQTEISRRPFDTEEQSRWVDMPLTAYASTFGLTPEEEDLFRAVRQQAAVVAGRLLPIVWQHRDFNEWNICRDGPHIRVLDWERARPGPPLADLIYFTANWSFLVRHLRSEDEQVCGFRALFADPVPQDAALASCRRAIDRYLSALEIDHSFYPLLLVLTWVNHALDQADRQHETGGRQRHPRANNRYIAYLSVLAAQVSSLFTGEPALCAS